MTIFSTRSCRQSPGFWLWAPRKKKQALPSSPLWRSPGRPTTPGTRGPWMTRDWRPLPRFRGAWESSLSRPRSILRTSRPSWRPDTRVLMKHKLWGSRPISISTSSWTWSRHQVHLASSFNGNSLRPICTSSLLVGGSIELGTHLSKQDLDKLKTTGHVVNCLGSNRWPHWVVKCWYLANNAGRVGGSAGTYYSNPGEVVIWGRCPRDFDYYVMDDDKDAGVMMTREGKLYLSTAAEAGEGQTRRTVADCDGVCQAIFGEKLSLSSGDGYESWRTDRPMRKEGFNIGAERSGSGLVSAENSGHGGAGVAASWACAALASDKIINILGRNW